MAIRTWLRPGWLTKLWKTEPAPPPVLELDLVKSESPADPGVLSVGNICLGFREFVKWSEEHYSSGGAVQRTIALRGVPDAQMAALLAKVGGELVIRIMATPDMTDPRLAALEEGREQARRQLAKAKAAAEQSAANGGLIA
jgi:hypothetical protein